MAATRTHVNAERLRGNVRLAFIRELRAAIDARAQGESSI
jgi:hypothetical protein